MLSTKQKAYFQFSTELHLTKPGVDCREQIRRAIVGLPEGFVVRIYTHGNKALPFGFPVASETDSDWYRPELRYDFIDSDIECQISWNNLRLAVEQVIL
jgi:hypothetical protein